jgi:Lrp/AsnC family transcriptional regulator, leucine-responsive regulatory protein
MHKLDVKDLKIIRELELDARQPISQIAKNVGLSKEVTNYRLKRILNNKITTRPFVLVDFGKLGILTYRIYLKLENVTPEKEKEIFEFLKEEQPVQWIGFYNGPWDIIMRLSARNSVELQNTLSHWLEKYGQYIAAKEIVLSTHHSVQPATYLYPEYKPEKLPHYRFEDDKPKVLDEKDFKILKALENNSRTPTIEIAKQIGLSANATSERIRRLEKEEVIRRYCCFINSRAIGHQYNHVLFKLHLANKTKTQSLINYCLQHPNVFVVVSVIGAWDFELSISTKDAQEFHKVMREITKDYFSVIKEYQYATEVENYPRNPFKNI